MALARQAATVVALHLLGYRTTAVDAGAVIYGTEPGSPAASHLGVGEVLTSIDGSATPSIADVASDLMTKRPGSVVTVTVDQLGGNRSKTVSFALGGVYVGSGGSETCLSPGAATRRTPLRRSGHDAACLGVTIDPFYATKGLPFPVTIDADGIVGPSAGLAFTLGLIEKLDPADLTAGMKIAATGTMAVDGTVGDVGGVAQKTVAVERAGATVFFVPPEEYSVAKQHAGSSLRVFSVTSAQQAVADLENLGGRLARPTR
jgi:PDZ domain-containing protein